MAPFDSAHPESLHAWRAVQNALELMVPEFQGGLFLGVIAVAVIDACNVLLLGMVQDTADDEAWHPSAGHQAGGGAPKIVTANVGLVAPVRIRFLLANDVRSCALGEPSPDVLVVAHERLRKHPDAPFRSGNRREQRSRKVVQIHTMAVGVLDEFGGNGPEVRFRIDVLPPHLQ